jgi:hypothetical protein
MKSLGAGQRRCGTVSGPVWGPSLAAPPPPSPLRGHALWPRDAVAAALCTASARERLHPSLGTAGRGGSGLSHARSGRAHRSLGHRSHPTSGARDGGESPRCPLVLHAPADIAWPLAYRYGPPSPRLPGGPRGALARTGAHLQGALAPHAGGRTRRHFCPLRHGVGQEGSTATIAVLDRQGKRVGMV